MKITKLEEQGMRLALCLARGGRQMTLPELAEKEQLSEALVAKVMGFLRRGGVVLATRGREGGYELACSPERLTVATVLSSLGRPLLDGCFANSGSPVKSPCPHVDNCSLRPVWKHLSSRVTELLEGITVAELAQQEHDVRSALAG